MRIIRPNPIAESQLVDSTVPANDYPAWAAGSYSVGDRVISGTEAYESLIDDNSDTIAAGLSKTPPSWMRLGYINRWRMFRDTRDSKTRQDGGFAVELVPNTVTNGLALLGMEGQEVTVTVTDTTDGVVYDQTFTITDAGVTNIWDYFFLPYQVRGDFVVLDLPPYANATIGIEVKTIGASDSAAAGRVLMGLVRDLGVTDHDTSVRWINFSSFNRNPFGALEIVPRRAIKLVNYPITVERSNTDAVVSTIDEIINEPSVFVGNEADGATIVFGLPRTPQVTYTNPSVTDLSIEVEEF